MMTTPNPLSLAVGRALIHFVWEGAAVAALLAAVLYAARTQSSRLRYGLAVTALLAMPLAFGVTLALRVPAASSATIMHLAPAAHNFVSQLAAPESEPARLVDRISFLVPLWIVGVLFSYVNELAERLRLSQPVVLLESCLADVPVVIGWFRPVILVPLGLLAGLPAGQMEAILIHELAHIRRYDYAINLLQGFVEGLFFYHPAVWWISRVVRAERENCCDDLVVAQCSDARAYVAALATLEQNRTIAGEAVLAATGGILMNRIRRLLLPQEHIHNAIGPALAVGLLLIAAGGSAVLAMVHPGAGPIATVVAEPTPVHSPAPAPAAAIARSQQPKQRTQNTSEDIPAPYRRWLDQDVVYLITAQEGVAFADLHTDDERNDFIEQFWLRRDPTPGTPVNEFKDEHYRRIAYANERYAFAKPGWRSDRGRIYINYGPPDEMESHPNGGGGIPYPFEKWLYRYIDGIGTNVIIEFDDVKNDGEYKLAPDQRIAR